MYKGIVTEASLAIRVVSAVVSIVSVYVPLLSVMAAHVEVYEYVLPELSECSV